MKRETKRAIKQIGRVLRDNKMETVPQGEEHLPNPLYNVRCYEDEIKALLKGHIPEDWDIYK